MIGKGRGRGGQYSTALSSSVARHLALFTAVECRVVEEGAAFTVPLGAFEVLVPLGPWYWLGALLLFFPPRFGRNHWTWLNVVIKVVHCFWVKLPSRLQKICLLQGTVDINLKLSVQTPQSGHLFRLQPVQTHNPVRLNKNRPPNIPPFLISNVFYRFYTSLCTILFPAF